MNRLPADVSRCVNLQCPIRHCCLRWLCRLDNLRTSFTCFDGGPECQGYWPATEQTTTQPNHTDRMNTNETPPCSTHPNAPHGFDRDGSHAAGRYVCDCEGWVAPDGAPSDAPTPETDEQEQVFWQAFESSPAFRNVYISTEQMDPVFDFARRLERDRDDARAEVERLREQADAVCEWNYTEDGDYPGYDKHCTEWFRLFAVDYPFCPGCGRKVKIQANEQP